MSTRYYHTGIVAADPQRIADFYIDVFDCMPTGARHDLASEPLSRGMAIPGAHITGLDVRLPGFGEDGPILEIFRLDHVNPHVTRVDDAGIMHIAFSVDDVDETLAHLVRAGGSLLGEPSTLIVEGVGTATFVYARDPEGNIVEIQKWNPSS